MLDRFRQFATGQHLFPDGKTVLLAVSGGRDSACMADLIHRCGLPFAIAHCNFHLRPGDCDRDELFVRRMAEGYGVPFHSVGFDTVAHANSGGMSVEEAARELRYRWFADLCARRGYACVAVAHHQDDSIETFFLNLFRGTGIAGLHGIRPVATLYGLRVVRPMLCFSRAEVDQYVARHGLAYVEDSTNGSLEPRRNRLRHELLPAMRRAYPSLDATMAANIRRLDEAGQVFDNYIALMRERLVRRLPRRVPTAPGPLVGIDLADLPQPQATILFELLRPYGVGESAVRQILADGTATGAMFGTPTHDLVLNRGRIEVAERTAPVGPQLIYSEEKPVGCSLCISVDADLLMQPFTLRPWQPGDRLQPFGFPHWRKVSDVLKDMKVSRLEKRHVWVLADARGAVVWLVGLMQDNRFRVSASTTHQLYIGLNQDNTTT